RPRRADRQPQLRTPRPTPPPLQDQRRLPSSTNRTRRIRVDHTPRPSIPGQPHRITTDRPPSSRSPYQPTPLAPPSTRAHAPSAATRQRTTRPTPPARLRGLTESLTPGLDRGRVTRCGCPPHPSAR